MDDTTSSQLCNLDSSQFVDFSRAGSPVRKGWFHELNVDLPVPLEEGEAEVEGEVEIDSEG